MQSLYRQLDNFKNAQEATYKLFLSNNSVDFFEPLLNVNLPPTLRLISYLKAFNLLTEPCNFAQELFLLKQEFIRESIKEESFEISEHYKRYLQNLHIEVSKDINRLFTEEPFFAHPETRKIVQKLTTLFCSERNFCIYKQGIHEIFAIAYLISFSGCEENFYCEAMNSVELAHLELINKQNAAVYAYFLGCKIMENIWGLYCDESDIEHVVKLFGKECVKNETTLENESETGAMPLHEAFNDTSATDFSDEKNNILEYITNTTYYYTPTFDGMQDAIFHKLSQLDNGLYERLQALKLENVFLLRWLRLVFIREVDLPFVSRMLDFFVYEKAKTGTIVFIEDFAVILLLNIRQELMKFDYSVLMRQFSLPALEQQTLSEIEKICAKAINFDMMEDNIANISITLKEEKADALNELTQFNKVAGIELIEALTSKNYEKVKEIAELLEAVTPENSREFSKDLKAQGAEIGEADAFQIIIRNLINRNRVVEGQKGEDGREIE